ncbi:MAG: DUF445 family protein [Candidatus Obscuribacterales bacterium]|nr:DUF445 family protein [Cyanobacteria bacterium HKST-UBA01]MCB9470779.1 DUF445 family protein [Candidatus Obscuribacterales bacterium]
MNFGFDLYALFASREAFIVDVLVPPILFGFHGWIATYCAVKMLFRPYNAWFIPGTKIQVPLTPGIFPKRQAKLSQSVATTITDTLLTPQDIKAKAEELVTQENIYRTVDLFIDSVLLKEFRDTTKLHRLASEIAQLSPTLLQHFIKSTIDSLEDRSETRIPAITDKIFDQVVLSSRINMTQATELSERLMENLLTPEKIRLSLIKVLSPQNINALDESINAYAGGPYRLLARIVGVKRICYEWKSYMENEPKEAQKLIADLIKRFGIKHQIAVQITSFDLRSMPLENVSKLKKNVIEFVEAFLIEHKDDLVEAAHKLEDEAMVTVQHAIVTFNPESIPAEVLDRTKRQVSTFIYSYLKRELGELVEQAIPKLGVHGLIVSKIDLFSPKQLEDLVKRICKNELKALEYFGGVIGAVMGIVQILINAITY